MAPLISVLIPTYNRPESIKKAVLSCLSQDYKNIEIIITDNSSNFDTENLISEIDESKIKYYKNSENIGPILNWKKAFEFSHGDWIIILPDDDYLINPFYFSDSVKIISKHKIDLIVTDCILGYPTHKSIGKSNHAKIANSQNILKGFWQEFNIPTIANLFRRSVTHELEFFYSNNILYSDIELWLKILQKSQQVYFYNIPSVYYTFHEENIVTTMSVDSLISNAVFIDSIFKNNLFMRNVLMKRYFLFISGIYQDQNSQLIIKLSQEYKLNTFWILSAAVSLVKIKIKVKIKKIINWILKR